MKQKVILITILILLSSSLTMASTVSFFEEFPDQNTFKKINEIDFETKIYLAAKNLSDFYKLKKKINNTKVKEVVYWPILEEEEGYWISPWSDRKALERIFNEIKNNNQHKNDKQHLEVMLDLETPLDRSKLFSVLNFKRNKKYLADFIRHSKDYNVSITTVEKSWLPDWLLKRLGLAYDSKKYGNKRIKMFYSSFSRDKLPDSAVDKVFEKKMKKFKKKGIIPSIGCIDVGILGDEPINNPQVLGRELEIINQLGFDEVVIFKLSGLNKGYLKEIVRFYK